MAVTLKEGDKAPVFTGKDQDGKKVSLSDYKGKNLVLYFYSEAGSPTCTPFNDPLVADIATLKLEAMALGADINDAAVPERFARMVAVANGETPMPVRSGPFDDLYRLCVLGKLIERNATPAKLAAALPAVGLTRFSAYFAGLEADGLIRRGKRPGKVPQRGLAGACVPSTRATRGPHLTAREVLTGGYSRSVNPVPASILIGWAGRTSPSMPRFLACLK